MENLSLKIKRQIEILSLVLESPNKYNVYDLSELFNVSDITIKRDLRELRSIGVDIHSNSQKGISITSLLRDDLIRFFIIQYFGVALSNRYIDGATNLLVARQGIKALITMTSLQKAIEQNRKIRIEYERRAGKPTKKMIVEPYCIFQRDKQWRLLGKNEETVKQFILSNILDIEISDEQINPYDLEELNEMFATSFKSWLSKDKIKVKIKFSPLWKERILSRRLMEYQKIEYNSDGSIIFETIVNSLGEIASWIVSRGKGIEVIEPCELRNIVIQLAQEALSNYNIK
ncbi:helix-turn-helix transcriptional regulator [Melioribacter sp. OK-6-Me]|uniref:helix-turn-helix transcriptional regulator n=1 Tax=unclassified Melioribacter TaxID=2627329 RepID=UPI003ED9DC3B